MIGSVRQGVAIGHQIPAGAVIPETARGARSPRRDRADRRRPPSADRRPNSPAPSPAPAVSPAPVPPAGPNTAARTAARPPSAGEAEPDDDPKTLDHERDGRRARCASTRRGTGGIATAIEIQKKFSLAAACIVLVLVGAPIALRFPRGGVGLVIGVSFVVFAVYYVGLIGGEALANKNIISPFWAMWAGNIIFARRRHRCS